MKYVLPLVPLLAVGCTGLPDLRPNTCGNGVLEPEVGEACDSIVDTSLGPGIQCAPADEASGCQYVCRNAACPIGWRCGGDSVCRQPSGQFSLGAAGIIETDARGLLLADLDDDMVDDIIVAGAERLDVWFSDTRGGLSNRAELAGTIVAPPAVSLLGTATVLAAPTGAGVQLFVAEPGPRMRSLPGTVSTPEGQTRFGYTRADGAPQLGRIGVQASGTTIFTAQDSLSLDASSGAYEVVSIARAADTLFLYEADALIVVGLDPLVERARFSLAPLRAFVAEIDGAGHPELWIQTQDTLLISRFDGQWSPPEPEARSIPGTLLTAADLDGDGQADAVTSTGVYLTRSSSTTLEPAFGPLGAPYTHAIAGQLDAEPGLDLALGQASVGRIEYRLPRGDIFVREAFQVQGELQALTAGDFDGDGVDDLAFATTVDGQSEIQVRLASGPGSIRIFDHPATPSIQVIRAPVVGSLADTLDDLLLTEGDNSWLFLGDRNQNLQAPFLFGDAQLSGIEAVVAAGTLRAVEPSGEEWSLNSGLPDNAPECLNGLPPACLLSVEGLETTAYAGPRPGCTIEPVLIRRAGPNCERLPLTPGFVVSDLTFARSRFIISGSVNDAGRVLLEPESASETPEILDFSTPVLSAALADLDSDTLFEVLALTETAVVPRLGSDRDAPQAELQLPGLRRSPRARLRTFDSNGDQLDDLAIGTESQLIIYRAEAAGVAP